LLRRTILGAVYLIGSSFASDRWSWFSCVVDCLSFSLVFQAYRTLGRQPDPHIYSASGLKFTPSTIFLQYPPPSGDTQHSNNTSHVLEVDEEHVLPNDLPVCGLTNRLTELKETHLAPLANSFGRSSSTSTITNEQSKPTSPLATSSPVTNDINGIGTYSDLFRVVCTSLTNHSGVRSGRRTTSSTSKARYPYPDLP